MQQQDNKTTSFLNGSGIWKELYGIIQRNLFFYKVWISIILVVVISLAIFLVYTYDRSFLVHQNTLMLAHNHNIQSGIPFFYEVHVGHDGTNMKPIHISGTLIQQAAGPVAESLVAAASTPVNSPLEQFAILPLIPMNIGHLYFSFTNPSLFMLLTLSLVLLLVHFVTKNGGGKAGFQKNILNFFLKKFFLPLLSSRLRRRQFQKRIYIYPVRSIRQADIQAASGSGANSGFSGKKGKPKPKRKVAEDKGKPKVSGEEFLYLVAQNRTARKIKGILEVRWSGLPHKIPTLESIKRAVAELGYNPKTLFDSLESSSGTYSKDFLDIEKKILELRK